jgi:hypothetical protein
VYDLSRQFNSFWLAAGIFSPKQVSRMQEAEFLSELLIAITLGISAKSKPVIDKAYRLWDEAFPGGAASAKRVVHTIDVIGAILEEMPRDTNFRGVTLFHSLFCAIYHVLYGLPGLRTRRPPMRAAQFPKVRIVLQDIDVLCAVPKAEWPLLTERELKFRQAIDVRTIHASNRLVRTEYVLAELAGALRK